jgi:Flp pilus assembly protein TadD
MDALPRNPVGQGLPTINPSISPREQAVLLHRAGHINHAVEFYKAYLQDHPKDTGIWSNLGACLRSRKQHNAALACYHRALHIDPANIAALGNLANVLKDLNRLDESLALHRQLVNSAPNDSQTQINFASALREKRFFERALQQIDQALKYHPEDPALIWERGQNLLHLGRYTEGLRAYEARWQLGELPTPDLCSPRWKGEALDGKRILLHAEQGYGDTILAARYIRLVKARGAFVILRCKPELHRLFAGIGADVLIDPDAECPATDYHCPLMSLLAMFNTELDAIPPPAKLFTSLEARRKFSFLHQQSEQRLNVAIVWSGSITFKNNHNRCASLSQFLSLVDIPELRLFSLQKGPRARELYEHGADAVIDNLGNACDDFADTAAALEAMDVVLMTDSSLAHLAGSLGKPVINLLQYVPYWIYSSAATTTPWYPSHRLVKQNTPGAWGQVFEEARVILKRMAMEKSIRQ